jgi:aryl-alcohol dehydrogenase-like predicted oxidoreductase
LFIRYIICLGTMNRAKQKPLASAPAPLYRASEKGINFIDTAEIYPIPPSRETQGLTETYLGDWLRKSGKRDELVIASKVASRNQAGSIKLRDASGGLSKKNIAEAIDGTLTRLGIEHVDLYQVHVPDRKANYFGIRGYATHDPAEDGVSIEETLEGLTDVVRAGKVRYIGISNETAWGLGEYLRVAREKGFARVVSIQNQYSLINRTYEVGLAEFAFREDVPLLAYSPLSKGVLTGKYLGGARPPGARFTLFERDIDRYNPDHAQTAIEAYRELANDVGLSLAQLSLAFVNTRPFLAATIIGARTLEQLDEDIGSINIELAPDVLERIAQLYRTMPDPTC